MFKLEEGFWGNADSYDEDPASLYSKSETYLLKSSGIITQNTACVTVISTGKRGRWLGGPEGDDGNALPQGDKFSFGYVGATDSCCLHYYQKDNCQSGLEVTICSPGQYELQFRAPSWKVTGCKTIGPGITIPSGGRKLSGEGRPLPV